MIVSDGRMGLLYRFSFIIGYLEGVFVPDAPGGESYSLFTLNYMILCNYLALYGFTSLHPSFYQTTSIETEIVLYIIMSIDPWN